MVHIGLNAHLLSGQAGYRSAGIHGYIHNTLRHLPEAAPPNWDFTALVGEQVTASFPNMALRHSGWNTESPYRRIIWEQALQPWQLGGYDLYHALAFVSPLLLTRPSVVTVYDLSFIHYPQVLSPARRFYLRLFTGLSCRRARRVIAISQSTARDLTESLGIPPEKIDVAVPGYAADIYRPLPPEQVAAFRQQKGLPERFWLFLGTLEPRKNLVTLLEAYAMLPHDERPPLVLAGGKGWDYESIFAAVERLGLADAVRFPGFVPTADLPLWYNSAELFLYPSVFEGFGLPVLEAMACGTPVIVSDASSLPEVVGDAGILVPPHDVPAWSAALHRAGSDPAWREDAKLRGLTYAARFTWEATAQATIASYQKSIEFANKRLAWLQTIHLSVVIYICLSGFYPTADVVLVFLSFVIGYYIRYELQIFRPVLEVNRAAFSPYLVYAAFYAVYLFLTYQGDKLYKNIRGRSWFEELTIIVNGVARVTVLAMAVSFFFQPLVSSRLMLAYVAGITIVLQSVMRVARRMVRAYLRTKGIGVQRVLVVGAGDVGKAVLRTMLARRELGYVPVGYVDDNPELASVSLGRLKGLGGTENLAQTVRNNFVDLVIITLPWAEHDRILELVQICKRAGVESRIVPDVFQLNLRQVHIENLDGIPLMGVNDEVTFQGRHWVLKRAIDVGLIILASPVLLALFGLIALAIRLEGPGPIFYTQRRVGLNGREFNIFKFRSMILNAEALRDQLVKEHGEDPRHPKIKNDPRITRVGHFIRRASLDELPNLINVVRGQMSLVGPRPPTPDEVQLYEPWHMQRLQVLPGLTGLWQVSGRNEVPFDEMCLLDIYYIENWSVKMDAQILMMTVPRVLLRHGAY